MIIDDDDDDDNYPLRPLRGALLSRALGLIADIEVCI